MGWIKRLFGIRKDIKEFMPRYEDNGRLNTVQEKSHIDKYEVDNNRIIAEVNGSLNLHYFYLKYTNWIDGRFTCIKDLDAPMSDHDKFYWSFELMRIQNICFGDMHVPPEYIPLLAQTDEEIVAIWFNTGREFLEHAKEAIRRNIYRAMRIRYQQHWYVIADGLIKCKYIKSQKDYDYYFDEYIRLMDRPVLDIEHMAYNTY